MPRPAAYEFHADFKYAEDPTAMQVVVNGIPHDMELEFGSSNSGVYVADLSEATLDPQGVEPDCYAYFFRAKYLGSDGETEFRFPEDGSYGIGGCDYDDSESKWMDFQFDIAGEDDSSDDELLEGARPGRLLRVRGRRQPASGLPGPAGSGAPPSFLSPGERHDCASSSGRSMKDDR